MARTGLPQSTVPARRRNLGRLAAVWFRRPGMLRIRWRGLGLDADWVFRRTVGGCCSKNSIVRGPGKVPVCCIAG